jgi:hypothetical protein
MTTPKHTHTDDAYYKQCPACNPQRDPTPAERAEQFRAEVMALLDAMDTKLEGIRTDIGAELEAIRGEMQQMREGLSHASQPAPAGSSFSQMMIDTIIKTTNDEGEPAYKALGAPYQKFGVRIWDEVLPKLGIDPATLNPGKNPVGPIAARVLMNAPQDGKPAQPRKVTGKV